MNNEQLRADIKHTILTMPRADIDPYGELLNRCYVALGEQPPHDVASVPDVSAMARILSNRMASACCVDPDDQWKIYGQEFIDDVRAMLAAAPQPVAQDGWIPVSERLPESGEPVIVWCDGSDQAGIAWIRQGAWYMPEPQAIGYESITHWMPLPAAPKGGE